MRVCPSGHCASPLRLFLCTPGRWRIAIRVCIVSHLMQGFPFTDQLPCVVTDPCFPERFLVAQNFFTSCCHCFPQFFPHHSGAPGGVSAKAENLFLRRVSNWASVTESFSLLMSNLFCLFSFISRHDKLHFLKYPMSNCSCQSGW